MLDGDSEESYFVCFWNFLFLSRPLLLYLLYLLSSDKSDSLDDEYDDDGSDSGSYVTCNFTFRFDDSIVLVSGVGSGVFVPIGVDPNCDVVMLVVFVPIGVDSKCGRLIEIFWHPKS